jgi:hypothetical protein
MVATSPPSGVTRYSACPPSLLPLNPNTRSPTSNDVTPRPTASTSPANSLPRIVTLGLASPVSNRTKKGLAARRPQSVRFTVVA